MDIKTANEEENRRRNEKQNTKHENKE